MPERDVDELLDSFAHATENVARPTMPRSRSSGLRAPALLATLVLVTVGAGLAVVYGPRLVPPGALPHASVDRARTFVTEWRLDGAAPPGPETRRLHILATQEACNHKRASVGIVLQPEVTYTTDDIVITLTATRGFDRELCDRVEEVTMPVIVDLTEPLAGRRIRDGQHEPARVRWQPRPTDAKALPTARSDPWPTGVPFVYGICPDVGLDAVLTGSPDDARLVWLVGSDGVAHERGLTWPPGFSVRFAGDAVQILNEANLVVRRGGDHVDGACAGGESLNLYATGYSPLDEGAFVEGTSAPRPAGLLTHRLTDLSSVPGTHSLIAGMTITGEAPCLYISAPERRRLTIWPAGTTIDVSSQPPVVRDAAGTRITTVGEMFTLNGVSVPVDQVAEVGPHLERAIPQNCSDAELLLVDPGVRALAPQLAAWRLDAAHPPPGTDSTVLHIEIQEQACSSRRDPRDRTLPPAIDYEPDRIVVTLSVLEIGGRCPGNPYFPMEIELPEPIGNRQLVDGHDDGVRWPLDLANAPTPTPAWTSTERWRIDAAAPIGPDTTSLRMLVSRTVCHDVAASVGVTSARDIRYEADVVVVTMGLVSSFDLDSCRAQTDVEIPTAVELREPLGNRVLQDGSLEVPAVRWRPLAPGAIALRTRQTEPFPLSVWVIGICAGVGLEGHLGASPDDPRLTWIQGQDGDSAPTLWWPPGFSIRDAETGAEILNEAGEVVYRHGDPVDGACVVGSTPDQLSLYGSGYMRPDN